MRIEDLDRKLQAWRADTEAMVTNVLELTSLTGYRLLSGGGLERLRPSPETEQVRRAVDLVEVLVIEMELLREVVERAAAEREALPRFRTARAVAAIGELLDGPSIALPAEAVPLEDRGLFTSSESRQMVTPAQLKATMQRNFLAAKPVLLRVDAAWNEVGLEIGAIATEAKRISGAFERAGQPPPREVQALQEQVARLQGELISNPLGVDAQSLEFVRSYLKPAERALEALRGAHQELAEQVAATQQRLESLDALVAEMQEMAQRAPTFRAPSVDAGARRQLGALLEAVREAAAAGDLAATQQAIRAFDDARRRIIGPIRAAHAELQRRAPQQGPSLMDRWLDAKAARAQVSAPSIAQDRGLDAFATKIDALFRQGGADDELDRLIYGFEVRLAELKHRV